MGSCSQHAQKGAIKSLDKPITLRVVGRGSGLFHFQFPVGVTIQTVYLGPSAIAQGPKNGKTDHPLAFGNC